MGNAGDNLKEVADYITTSVDEDGVKNALVHFGVIWYDFFNFYICMCMCIRACAGAQACMYIMRWNCGIQSAICD